MALLASQVEEEPRVTDDLDVLSRPLQWPRSYSGWASSTQNKSNSNNALSLFTPRKPHLFLDPPCLYLSALTCLSDGNLMVQSRHIYPYISVSYSEYLDLPFLTWPASVLP